jgi:hypothetical protein
MNKEKFEILKLISQASEALSDAAKKHDSFWLKNWVEFINIQYKKLQDLENE